MSLKNVSLTVTDKTTGKQVFAKQGEMLFTHFGVSGPLVLSASVWMRPMEPGRYALSIDLKPALTPEQLDVRLVRDFEENSNRDFCNALDGLLPKKLIDPVVALSGIPAHQKVNALTKVQRAGAWQAAQAPDPYRQGVPTHCGSHRHRGRGVLKGSLPQNHGKQADQGVVLCRGAAGRGRLHWGLSPANGLFHRLCRRGSHGKLGVSIGCKV